MKFMSPAAVDSSVNANAIYICSIPDTRYEIRNNIFQPDKRITNETTQTIKFQPKVPPRRMPPRISFSGRYIYLYPHSKSWVQIEFPRIKKQCSKSSRLDARPSFTASDHVPPRCKALATT